MRRRIKQASIVLLVFAVLLAAAQFIRPAHADVPTVASRTIAAHPGVPKQLVAVLGRSCGGCHSNTIESRWYTQTAPLSWIMARAASEGRRVVNFSEWGGYSPEQRAMLLAVSCQDARAGKMPVGVYTTFNRQARLSESDIETICAGARLVQTTGRTR